MALRPGKRAIATAAPSGKPMTAEHKVDVRLTASDNATIAVTRGSNCVTIASATEKLSAIVFIRTAYCAAGLQFYAILTSIPGGVRQVVAAPSAAARSPSIACR